MPAIIISMSHRSLYHYFRNALLLTDPRHLYFFFFFLMIRRPPSSPLFPYTPLFRSAMQQVRLRPGPHLGPLLLGALAEVVVFGRQPQMTVFQLGELRLEPRHRLFGRLEQGPPTRVRGRRVRHGRLGTVRRVGGLALFVVVLHRSSLHQAIGVPISARRSGGVGPGNRRFITIVQEASCQNGTGKLGLRARTQGATSGRAARRRIPGYPRRPAPAAGRAGFRDTSPRTTAPRLRP